MLLQWYRGLGAVPLFLVAALAMLLKFGGSDTNTAGLALLAAWVPIFCLSAITMVLTLLQFRRVTSLFAEHPLDLLGLYLSLLWFSAGTLVSALFIRAVSSPLVCLNEAF